MSAFLFKQTETAGGLRMRRARSEANQPGAPGARALARTHMNAFTGAGWPGREAGRAPLLHGRAGQTGSLGGADRVRRAARFGSGLLREQLISGAAGKVRPGAGFSLSRSGRPGNGQQP